MSGKNTYSSRGFGLFLATLAALPSFATLPVIKAMDVRGTYEATVLIIPTLEQTVKSLLPAGLELAPQNVVKKGFHPVLLILGKQEKVRNVVGSFSGPSFAYTETVLAVPYTQLSTQQSQSSGYRGPFYFMPKIFLNNVVPMFLGLYYGYNKVLRRFDEQQPQSYNIREWISTPVVEAHFHPVGAFAEARKFSNFAEIKKMLQEPVIGKRFDGFVCSHFDWNESNDLRLQPVVGSLKIFRPLMKQFGPLQKDFDSLAKVRFGAFDVVANWFLSGPYNCSSMR